MVAGDLIRLAWEAEHDGRGRLRDALLTLAVAESTPDDHPWVDRCRDRLVACRPDHFLAHFETVPQALADARVIEARERLRVKYPPPRVRWLLLRAQAARGPFLGRVESLEAMIDDLTEPAPSLGAEAENVRLDAAQPSRGPIHRVRVGRPLALALAYPPPATGLEEQLARSRQLTFAETWGETVAEPPVEDFPIYYLTVLLAIAFLLASVQQSKDQADRG